MLQTVEKLYAKSIIDGKRTLDDVPEVLREEVAKFLNEIENKQQEQSK